VLAHEVTHIRNGDARLAVIAAVFAGIISLPGELLIRGGRAVLSGGGGGGRGRSSGSGGGGSSRRGGTAAAARRSCWC
jgi:heat shock protein HtpX